MAKWANALLLDGGSDLLRTRAALATGRVKQHVIKAYTSGDSYATVAGNSCGAVDIAAGDLVQSGAAGATRTTTVAAKSGVSLTANSGAAPNNHIALVDSVSSDVLLVTDETNDQQLFSGNLFNFPSWTYNVGQPA